MAFTAKLDVALFANQLGGFTRRLEPFAGIKFIRVFRQKFTYRCRHRQTDVGVNIDFSHTNLNGFLNFSHGNAEGLLHLAAVLVDGGQQVLWHAAGAMHHQVGVGNALVNGFDAINRQNISRGFTGELVGAVAGANGNRQSVELRGFDKLRGFFGVGEQLLTRHGGVGAVAVFFVALHGLKRPQATQFALDGDAQLMRHLHHFACDVDVVIKAGNGFAVGL